MTSTLVATVGLLILSNLFMTLAWYGHLRFTSLPLWLAVMASWGVAFFEYCLQVPANRIEYHAFSAYELKILQEIITLSVFIVFAEIYLGEGTQTKACGWFCPAWARRLDDLPRPLWAGLVGPSAG
jgi:uncharacterized protein (DUF486 family)